MVNRSQKSEVRSQTENADSSSLIESIENALRVPNLFARILVSRGMESPEEAEAFLYPKLDDLSDPFLLPDIEKGVDRTVKAIKKMEHICIYGDYDADGITSAALMTNFFRHLGLLAEVYLPMRKEGYGLNIEAVKRIAARGTKLLICVDCGSSNVDEIRAANELGMDVIVIDHHEVPATIPAACALINPKRKDSRFPTRDLAACGVTFFFLWALRRVMHNDGLLKDKINLKRELDIVALGTLGDMAPLIKDNRILVKFGIDAMKKRPRLWLKSIFKKGLIPRRGIDEYTLNFIIIPRINAAGRVSDPKKSLDFLICEDEGRIDRFLDELHEANSRRQKVGSEILKEIIAKIDKNNLIEQHSFVLFKEDWHIGVIGIVAQKLVEMFGKPAIVITEVDGICKGSGRGGDGLNLHETLSSLSPLLLKYGGHKYACGISITKDNLIPFREAFEKSVHSVINIRQREVFADAPADFEDLTEELMGFIESLSPFGVGNARPCFLLAPLSVASIKNGHIKITDRTSRTWHGYNQTQTAVPQSENVSIIASPALQEDMGKKFIHLNVKGFA